MYSIISAPTDMLRDTNQDKTNYIGKQVIQFFVDNERNYRCGILGRDIKNVEISLHWLIFYTLIYNKTVITTLNTYKKNMLEHTTKS